MLARPGGSSGCELRSDPASPRSASSRRPYDRSESSNRYRISPSRRPLGRRPSTRRPTHARSSSTSPLAMGPTLRWHSPQRGRMNPRTRRVGRRAPAAVSTEVRSSSRSLPTGSGDVLGAPASSFTSSRCREARRAISSGLNVFTRPAAISMASGSPSRTRQMSAMSRWT